MFPTSPGVCLVQIVWLQLMANKCVPTGWLDEWSVSGLIPFHHPILSILEVEVMFLYTFN